VLLDEYLEAKYIEMTVVACAQVIASVNLKGMTPQTSDRSLGIRILDKFSIWTSDNMQKCNS
jgi:hypothetical protein